MTHDRDVAERRGFGSLVTLRRSTVIGGTAATLGLNATAMTLNFLVTLALSRMLGVEGYGAYAYAFAWAIALSSAAVLGLSPLVIRNVAAYAAEGSWDLMKGIVRRANQAVLVSSSAILAIAAAAGWSLQRGQSELLYPYLIGLLLVPLIALTSLRQAAMQSLGRIVAGRIPEAILAPLLLIVIASVLTATFDDVLTATWAMAIHVFAFAVAFGVGAALLRRTLPDAARSAPNRYETRLWGRSALPLFMATGVGALSAPLGAILLGIFGGPAEVGAYSVAVRVAIFTSFLSLAASYPLMPAIARLHASGQRVELQRLLSRSTQMIFVLSLPVAVLLALLAEPILQIFGTEFEAGVDALRILVLGEALKLVAGFGGLALLMTGNEGGMPRSLVFGLLVTSTLGVTLIPAWGVVGAAVATSAGSVVSAFLMAFFMWRSEGIVATVLPGSVR